jgi:hypothetical protein
MRNERSTAAYFCRSRVMMYKKLIIELKQPTQYILRLVYMYKKFEDMTVLSGIRIELYVNKSLSNTYGVYRYNCGRNSAN